MKIAVVGDIVVIAFAFEIRIRELFNYRNFLQRHKDEQRITFLSFAF